MSRPKEYNLETVLTTATEVFLEKGFDGSSMNELVARTGLNKHSMYSEFKDKEGLFIACIDHYANDVNSKLNAMLATTTPGLASIKTFFENRLIYASNVGCQGCLLVNSLSDKEILSERINKHINDKLAYYFEIIHDNLAAAIRQNELNENLDCDAMANFFTIFVVGLMTTAKQNPEPKTLKYAVDTALSVLEQYTVAITDHHHELALS